MSERRIGLHQLSHGVASVVNPRKVSDVRVALRAQVLRKRADNMADQ